MITCIVHIISLNMFGLRNLIALFFVFTIRNNEIYLKRFDADCNFLVTIPLFIKLESHSTCAMVPAMLLYLLQIYLAFRAGIIIHPLPKRRLSLSSALMV